VSGGSEGADLDVPDEGAVVMHGVMAIPATALIAIVVVVDADGVTVSDGEAGSHESPQLGVMKRSTSPEGTT